MVSEEMVTAGVLLVGSLAPVAEVWLRSLFRLRVEREQRRDLYAAAATLPEGSRVDEQRGDGTYVSMTIGGSVERGGGRH